MRRANVLHCWCPHSPDDNTDLHSDVMRLKTKSQWVELEDNADMQTSFCWGVLTRHSTLRQKPSSFWDLTMLIHSTQNKTTAIFRPKSLQPHDVRHLWRLSDMIGSFRVFHEIFFFDRKVIAHIAASGRRMLPMQQSNFSSKDWTASQSVTIAICQWCVQKRRWLELHY